jgi:hypothetical protein
MIVVCGRHGTRYVASRPQIAIMTEPLSSTMTKIARNRVDHDVDFMIGANGMRVT